MRHVGTVGSQAEAVTFADYLLTQAIRARIEREDSGWAVWIVDEDQVARGRQEFAEFQNNPGDAKYAAASAKAAQAREETGKQVPRSRVINLRDRWARTAGTQPMVVVLLAFSILVTLGTSFGERKRFQPLVNRLLIAPQTLENAKPGLFPAENHLAEVRRGEVWRLLTPIFLHFNLMHIFYNMLMLQALGNAVEFRRGTWAMTGLVLLIALVSNLAEYEVGVLVGSDFPGNFGGMSGVVYGLFGYVWAKDRFDPSAGLGISPQTVTILMLWLVICMTGVMGPVANTAHVAGLLTGGAAALLPVALRRAR